MKAQKEMYDPTEERSIKWNEEIVRYFEKKIKEGLESIQQAKEKFPLDIKKEEELYKQKIKKVEEEHKDYILMLEEVIIDNQKYIEKLKNDIEKLKGEENNKQKK